LKVVHEVVLLKQEVVVR